MANDDWMCDEIIRLRGLTFAASGDTAGVIKVGDGLEIDADGRLSVAPFYGYEVDGNNHITYIGASAGMSQAERKQWSYSKVKPTVVRNGLINYLLDRHDLTKKADGTAANLDGSDGDVCASFSPIYWKIEAKWSPNAGSGGLTANMGAMSVRISEYPQAGYVTAHVFDGRPREYVHIGMFEATGTTCSSIYSTTELPKNSQKLVTFRGYANTKNAGLAEPLYNPVTYLTWVMYQVLAVHAYGTFDLQPAVGNGNSSSNAYLPTGCAEILTCGGEYGSTTATDKHVMCLFVVNPWGNYWEFRDASIAEVDADGTKFAMAIDQADIYNIEGGYTNKPASYHEITSAVTASQWIHKFTGDPYGGFFPYNTINTSDSVGDYIYASAGEKCCVVGGYRWDAANCGVFACSVYSGLTHSSGNIGARLQVMNAA